MITYEYTKSKTRPDRWAVFVEFDGDQSSEWVYSDWLGQYATSLDWTFVVSHTTLVRHYAAYQRPLGSTTSITIQNLTDADVILFKMAFS